MINLDNFKSPINIKALHKNKIKNYFFYIGIFFLPSALSIAVLFLTISFILSNHVFKKKYLKDVWNIPFVIISIFMLISTICHFMFIANTSTTSWDPTLSILGLFNWIPLFWIFWSVQPFLQTDSARRRFALILLCGTLPVLLTGIFQYFLNWTGPFKLFNGLVTWYLKPLNDFEGLSGLFSNPNYAGSWLNIVWPFSIALVLKKSESKVSRVISIFFLILIALCIILTNSRNAWGGLISSISLVIGAQSFFWLLPIFFIIAILLMITTSSFFQGGLQESLRLLIPDKVWMEFSQEGFRDMDISRVGIWIYSLTFILSSPIFGYGAASFPILLEMQTNFWKGHTHNIFLEIAVSYGIPCAITLLFTIVFIVVISFKKIYFKYKEINNNIYFERAWWASSFVLIASQFADIQYFDGRISITFWILLAGLKNIITTNLK